VMTHLLLARKQYLCV